VVRDTLYREYKKYGDISVRVMHEPDERVAYVYFRNFDDARDAKHSKSRIILFDKPAMVEAVYESASREEYDNRGARPHSNPQAYLHPAMVEMGLEAEEVAMADPGLQTGTETNIERSPGIAADHPVAAVVEVVMTWGSEVPRIGVDLGMVTGTISGDHPGALQGVLHLVTTGGTMEGQFHQCRVGTTARRGQLTR